MIRACLFAVFLLTPVPLSAGVSVSAAGGAGASTAVDLVLDMESGSDTDTISATILNASLHSSAALGAWSFYPTTLLHSQIRTAYQQASRYPVTIGGVSHATAGTRGYCTDQNYAGEQSKIQLPAPAAEVSWSYAFNTSMGYDHYWEYTYNSMKNSNLATWCDLRIRRQALGDHVMISTESHSASGTTFGGWITPIYHDTWYWVTEQWSQSAQTCTLSVYLMSDWSLVGTSQGALDDVAASVISLGKVGGEATADNFVSCFDSYMVDWTKGTFPLLPTAAASAAVNVGAGHGVAVRQ